MQKNKNVQKIGQFIKNKKLKNETKQAFADIHFLESKEVDSVLKNIESLPEEALQQILKEVKQGKQKEINILKKINNKNKSFNEDLLQFLENSYQNNIKEVTKNEQEDAEKIIELI